MSSSTDLNDCRMCGGPAEMHTRREFHEGDTMEVHLGRRGLTMNAKGDFADEMRRDFRVELDDLHALNDVRASCTRCQNATGWRPTLRANGEYVQLGISPEMITMARDKVTADVRAEWNAKNLSKADRLRALQAEMITLQGDT